MNARKTCVLATVWGVSLVTVAVWGQGPEGPSGGTFGRVFSLGPGLTARYRGRADSFETSGGTTVYRGNVTISLPDPHFVVLADEAVMETGPTTASGRPGRNDDLMLQGNVRLRFVRP
jgi:hypothetical protein